MGIVFAQQGMSSNGVHSKSFTSSLYELLLLLVIVNLSFVYEKSTAHHAETNIPRNTFLSIFCQTINGQEAVKQKTGKRWKWTINHFLS